MRVRRRRGAGEDDADRLVAARLLDSVAAIDYPRDRLEIQVLDDSTDETAALVSAHVDRLRARGVDARALPLMPEGRAAWGASGTSPQTPEGSRAVATGGATVL